MKPLLRSGFLFVIHHIILLYQYVLKSEQVEIKSKIEI